MEKEIEDLKSLNNKFLEEKKNDSIQLNLMKSQIENVEKLNKEYEIIIGNLNLLLENEKQNTKANKQEKDLTYDNKQFSTDDDEK